MPSLTLREYNPSTGEFVGNASSLSFGRVRAGNHSPVKVIDLSFFGVSRVSNVGIGLMDAGGLTVNDNEQTAAADGSVSNGRFGIMHTMNFDLETASGPLTRHFAGLNTSLGAGDPKNVAVGSKSDRVSQFIYLDIEFGENDLGKGGGMYKVFFDFEE